MGWHIPSQCQCGNGEKTINHLINEGSILAPGRPTSITRGFNTPLTNYDEYIFRENSALKEIAEQLFKFFNSGESSIIILKPFTLKHI